ncbi:hypothetical protein WME76_22475 [Sorangium sp. So ce119]|uniref:hypothetical protein n=1 Tax=Sorangium sp. So ce119 TaxID=3133279 RepID=UPI003F5FD56A
MNGAPHLGRWQLALERVLGRVHLDIHLYEVEVLAGATWKNLCEDEGHGGRPIFTTGPRSSIEPSGSCANPIQQPQHLARAG